MPLKPHPTDPDKMVYVNGGYTKLIPMQTNLPEATTALGTVVKPKRWVECAKCKKVSPLEEREWVGLTDAEIEGAIDEGFAFGLDDGNVSNKIVIRYVRVIEAMLKEKNT